MNGHILAKNDPRIEDIPVHPNCRCYVEAVESIVAGTATSDGTDGVDLYVAANGALPDNYLRKKKAQKLGWNPLLGNLADILPGMLIGGDIYKNRIGGTSVNHFILDFSEVKTLLELHQYLKEVFSLPDYYGNNMDALWDCLSCCYDETTTIELRNLDVLRKRLERTTQTMLGVFQDLHDEDGVIINIVQEERPSSEKSFEIGNDDLSGYMI